MMEAISSSCAKILHQPWAAARTGGLTPIIRTTRTVTCDSRWTREALLRSVWGTDWASDTHLVEVHIGNLRRKLGEKREGPHFIRTVRGVGYRMELAE